MEIVLLERVEKLGQIGDVVNVKPGYARNYLLPRGKALRANKQNMAKFEAERSAIEERNADAKKQAEMLSESIGDLSVNLVRAASEMGQLYGSVTARDIAEAVSQAGHEVDKRQVTMESAIKNLGLFTLKLTLHAEVTKQIVVNVARSLEEAKTQLESGKAVISNLDEDDEDERVEAAPEIAAASDATEVETVESAEADTPEAEEANSE
ncbi:MAG: 50S ribosomal protein L9 [SAR116 cluster bacterium]|jgi:large subunit ribosomal protein L9|nr:50S ribosomal protein L9 [Alphaproteobacteria bacterium]RCL80058.1 MAG: 50S ribosomal protein L9 [SAR116 cluster bacterium]CAI8388449.1 MAG: 50S ribosomal protein L9 [SAR116 cluster bacterium]|tara:strand:- start:239 stop:865 length:627 start_codon:yes stop_codon:yes gene_type:complete